MGSILKFFKTDNLYSFSVYARQIAGTLVLLLLARFLSVYEYGLFRSYAMISLFALLLTNLDYGNYILVSSKANVHEVKLKISFFVVNSLILMLIFIFIAQFFNIEKPLILNLVLVRTFLDMTFFALVLPYFQATKKFNIISYVNIFYSIMTIIFAYICYKLKTTLLIFLLLGIALGIINFIQCSYYAKINYLLFFNHAKKIMKPFYIMQSHV